MVTDKKTHYKIGMDTVHAWLAGLFHFAGLKMVDANVVAENIVEAEARGVLSHGLILTKLYVERIIHGGIKKDYDIKLEKDTPALTVIDGGGGPGQVLAHYAIDIGIKKAKQHGITATHLTNSNHIGMLATYALKAANEGVISIVMTNTGPSVAAFNGHGKQLGNNAICFAFPSNPKPFLLDMATGVVACGKIRVADLEGERIDEGWMRDVEGHITTDPAIINAGGYVLPFGLHKGFGISMMIDLFTGVLVNSITSPEVYRQRADVSSSTRAGQTFITIDMLSYGSTEQLKDNVNAYVQLVKGFTPNYSVAEVTVPEEKEQKSFDKSQKEGLYISENIKNQLDSIAESVNYQKLNIHANG